MKSELLLSKESRMSLVFIDNCIWKSERHKRPASQEAGRQVLEDNGKLIKGIQ